MILGIPLAVWLGIVTFTSLIVTASLGVAFHVFHKNVFKYHRIFAFITIGIAIAHSIIAFLLWFMGIAL